MAPALLRIRCVKRTDPRDPRSRIHSIGGQAPDGPRWGLTEPEAISGIEAGTWAFYVEQPAGHRVNVVVARTAQGTKYLKTEPDGERPDNLLSLPECP
jgi:hypothetical protein